MAAKPEDRKPKSKEPADVVLNKFLTDNGILLAMTEMQMSKSTDGSITLRPARPTAVYAADVPKKNATPPPQTPVPISGNGVK